MTDPRSARGLATSHRLDWQARERIELALPTEPELWALARLTASSVAARIDFGYDEIEDLRLAIDELCTACASGAGPLSRLHLCFESSDDSLRVECVVDHVTTGPRDEDKTLPDGTGDHDLAEMILTELVEDHEIGPIVSGSRRAYLEKRRATSRP